MKTILISGGSSGLGKAMAEHFAKNHRVIILARNPEHTAQAAKGIGCEYVIADVANPSQVKNAVEEIVAKHQTIDCLINNAGLWIQGALETNDSQRIIDVMDVNTTGTILLTHAVLPFMKKAGHGRIINVISQAGLHAKAERSVYNASKWAVTGFTQCMQEELTGTGVAVTGFYPGAMKTELFEHAGNSRDLSKYMELSEVVRAVEFILETPDDVTIPELGIKPAFY